MSDQVQRPPSDPLTEDELRAIEERASKATPGPWTGDPEPFALYIYGADGGMVADTTVPGKYGDGSLPDFADGARGGVDAVLRLRGVGASKHRPEGSLEANYRFMIHAREDVDRLLATVRAQQAEIDRLNGISAESNTAEWFRFLDGLLAQDATLERPIAIVRALWSSVSPLVPRLRLPVTSPGEDGVSLSWRTRDGKHFELVVARDGSVDWLYRDTPRDLTVASRDAVEANPIDWKRFGGGQFHGGFSVWIGGGLLYLSALDNGNWLIEDSIYREVARGAASDTDAAKSAAIAAARKLLTDALAELGGDRS